MMFAWFEAWDTPRLFFIKNSRLLKRPHKVQTPDRKQDRAFQTKIRVDCRITFSENRQFLILTLNPDFDPNYITLTITLTLTLTLTPTKT